MYIGCHLSIAKGFEKATQTAIRMNADTFQFFTRNPRGGKARALDLEDIQKMERLRQEKDFGPLIAHAPYTLNPCSKESKTQEFAFLVFREDLKLLQNLSNCFYNFHPGAHVGEGIQEGIRKTAHLLNQIIYPELKTSLLIETMAGQGTEIGSTFEEIAQIIEKIHDNEKIGVCLDTCHVFAAGYDIKFHLDNVLEKFDRIIGISRLKAIHLNDSLMPFSSHKDRHARIGMGEIGLSAILSIVNHPLLKNLPFILETPQDEEGHAKEIRLLRQ